MRYETTIGLEIHTQLSTKSKMFCRCDNFSVEAKPNTNVCPVCMGMPGTLPIANQTAIEWTIKTGLALNCKIAKITKFDRKSYFYPDLPKNYQISQYDTPITKNGSLGIETLDKEGKSYITKIGITRTHLEEDAGKLVHPEGKDYSLVDLNRAGTPLMEIVTEPDLRSPLEARIFMQNLRAILRYLGVSLANMEEGNLRCDANISLRPAGSKTLGAKVEIKNMNSFKALERALEYEAERQTELLESGEKIVQETRGWVEAKQKTVSLRIKEETFDYRYFPEPDIPPITANSQQPTANSIDIEKIRAELPELPREKQKRFEKEYGLSSYDAFVLTGELELANFFERTLEKLPQITEATGKEKKLAKKISNWITSELLARLNKEKIEISKSKVTPQGLAELVDLIDKGEISGKIAKDIFDEMFKTGEFPSKIVKEKGLRQVSDKAALVKIIEKVISENKKTVEDYKKGKEGALMFLVGQVMRATKGQAAPQKVNEILREKLS
ncbi:MAG: Asp-tRNA(Asn)/Glu-tRNA(Gln) amidotransferase subunit GatB [Candidatus Aenigmarchaeota archaeon]|nr:Asp-tRNA(Asn)/Glu-tRNA(Gln) amidotransferase subunit GatB [Candidatus Aenigmarchaeota archaeon]